ncbi:ABC transporter related [Dinoroseobacter shibae DFL 12 = DSM 16493]|jgi:peptide/nickel transport system permease protein|uniref:ABC transporter related n=1 Tax=Dinoroseobacter shibae (strain DSM 16493 / NCIMB 14021 / DFL 12) TaxID=398580 RepID=A8LKG0_DINSH|nr:MULTISPECIES: ABC transporter permease [Dinoroseobacter]ABV94743.1 ABC transporter related [Dinoroseobacter shibae DFL 12 = DSM 16493]MDD9716815.1 ABC transporter permease [Dinoroseobacter sp. PD6]URF46164.1 ABC transporter permease [Dinoroseobacter shibae]URF50471.1 ABC transporter permease [Dinoroseobacter shibae]
MFGIPRSYLINRTITFVLTVFIAATLIWLIPRFSPVDPAEIMLSRMAAGGGAVADSEAILAQLRADFGLNDPLIVQYLKYMGNLLTFNLGISTASFPTPVSVLIAQALPWTLGLMILSVVITFVIGNALGAFMVWERTPKIWKVVIPTFMIFTSIPPILSGLLLMYIFSITLRWLPLTGSYGLTVEPGWDWAFISSVIEHGTLPALSIIVVTFGFWTLGMRGLMISVQGEDYVNLAKAKGLKPRYVLYKYMVRNAILPQITAFALKIGLLVSGQILVERIFGYNGMGKLLYDAILDQDFAVIQGVSYIIILMTALSVFLVDLIYPLIDPRIRLSEEAAT